MASNHGDISLKWRLFSGPSGIFLKDTNSHILHRNRKRVLLRTAVTVLTVLALVLLVGLTYATNQTVRLHSRLDNTAHLDEDLHICTSSMNALVTIAATCTYSCMQVGSSHTWERRLNPSEALNEDSAALCPCTLQNMRIVDIVTQDNPTFCYPSALASDPGVKQDPLTVMSSYWQL